MAYNRTPYWHTMRHVRGLAAPSAVSGATSVLTAPSGVDWSTVPWYAVPFIGVDVGVMKAYCLANPTSASCGFTAPPPAAAPGAPQTPTQMTVPGAYTPEQSAADAAANSQAAWQKFFDQLGAQTGSNPSPACDPGIDPTCADNRPWYCKYLGIGCDSSGLPGWLVAGGLLLGGVVVLGAIGGRH